MAHTCYKTFIIQLSYDKSDYDKIKNTVCVDKI